MGENFGCIQIYNASEIQKMTNNERKWIIPEFMIDNKTSITNLPNIID